MRHVSATALVPIDRHARLFELIRQENLAAKRASCARAKDHTDGAADFLKKAAAASLRRRP